MKNADKDRGNAGENSPGTTGTGTAGLRPVRSLAERGNTTWEDDDGGRDDDDSDVLRWRCEREELLIGMVEEGEEAAVL